MVGPDRVESAGGSLVITKEGGIGQGGGFVEDSRTSLMALAAEEVGGNSWGGGNALDLEG